MRFLALLLLMAVPAFAQTSVKEYAAQCRDLVGDIPVFQCADGASVPITIDGQPVTDYVPDMTCDRPALLNNGPNSDGQCVPYSRILNLSNDKTQVAVMCRQKVIRGPDQMEFSEIDVIAHNPATGATCWFQATEDDVPVSGIDVPSPTQAIDNSFWNTPVEVAADGCGNCHDNDPFMYSPFVGQVWGQVPVNPMGAYFHVGDDFNDWPLTSLDMRDNTCTGCHRIGIDQTCGQLAEWATGIDIPPGADAAAASFPLSHSMPPEHGLTELAWNVIHKQSIDDLRSCCLDNTQSFCVPTAIPGYRP